MADIGKTLRDEIARVAVREGKKLIAESKKLVGEVKREIAELRQQLAKQEKDAAAAPAAKQPAAKKAAAKQPAAKKAAVKKPAAKKAAAKKPAAVKVSASAAAKPAPKKAKAAKAPAASGANAVTVTPANIKSLRNRLGVSQEDFGRLCGVSKKTISTWELSKSPKLKLRDNNLEGLAKVKQMTAADAKKAVAALKQA